VLGKGPPARGVRARLCRRFLLLAVLAATGIDLSWDVAGVLGALTLLMLGTAGLRVHVDAVGRPASRSASASSASAS